MPMLHAGDVHVRIARVTVDETSLTALEKLLNAPEKAAAGRFIFDRHRVRYIFAHGVLRQILSCYVDQKPEEIRFDHNRFGKPSLAGPASAAHTRFNMSHSGDLVMVALTRDRHIGADVELIRPMHDFSALAKSNFTPAECDIINRHPPDVQPKAFFTCWTRKEAFIKAVGKGLSIPLNTFDSSIPDGQAGRRLTAPNGAPDVESWWIADLSVPDGYTGAIAVEEGLDDLSYHLWDSAM